MVKIHQLSVVDTQAEIADDVEIGPFCTVGPHVKIGAGTKLISHVVIDGFTTIGARNTMYPYASLGLLAQHKRSNAPDATLTVGDDNIFREHFTAHVGSEVDQKKTIIGSRNWFLAYAHVAHDCVLGNDIVMSNNASLAGHARIDDRATISGFSGVAQFVRIGEGAFLNAGAFGLKDVIPYGIVMKDGMGRKGLAGLNLIGLQRMGVEKQDIFTLQKAYAALFDKSNSTFAERIAAVEANADFMKNALVQKVIAFVKAPSKNNILMPEE